VPYGPRGFTVAYPYLPFGTRLSVSYNDRSVIVTVNDRTPYGSDHDLDLSRAAAQAMTYREVGTAVVDEEVIETRPTSSP
jgi:rare lipoprotein A